MRIAVLLSGGVDSAVAVHLLQQQGHELHLFYIQIGLITAKAIAVPKRILKCAGL